MWVTPLDSEDGGWASAGDDAVPGEVTSPVASLAVGVLVTPPGEPSSSIFCFNFLNMSFEQ